MMLGGNLPESLEKYAELGHHHGEEEEAQEISKVASS